MALVEDVLTSNVAKVLAVGAVAVVLPRVAPALPAPLRGVVKSGLKLFIESESDAEGGAIAKLADAAMQQALASLSGPGTEEERQRDAEAAVQRFHATSRHRAARYGRDAGDRDARYRRHMDGLRHALRTAQAKHPHAGGGGLGRVAGQIEASAH